jgi:hypothetical protein
MGPRHAGVWQVPYGSTPTPLCVVERRGTGMVVCAAVHYMRKSYPDDSGLASGRHRLRSLLLQGRRGRRVSKTVFQRSGCLRRSCSICGLYGCALRTRIQNALQAIALANGLRRGPGCGATTDKHRSHSCRNNLLRVLSPKQHYNFGFGAISRPDSLTGFRLQGRSAFVPRRLSRSQTDLARIFMLRGCREAT